MTADVPLCLLLQRLDRDPPNFHADEFPRSQVAWRCQMEAAGLLRSISASTSASCLYCGDNDLRQVTFLADQRTGGKRGYICCRDCGVVEVPQERLQRWTVDIPRFLHAAFSPGNVSVRPVEATEGHLWKIGEATWAGRLREVWFGRTFRQARIAQILKPLSGQRKAILFTPTDLGAVRWQQATKNLVIALESTLSLKDGRLAFRVDYVESRLIDAGMGSDAPPKRNVRKRSERAANIELLTREVIEHLREGRDHAFATMEHTGVPALLPRPTQTELAVRVGLTKWDVSRCLKDPKARELRLYWDAALQLDQVMAWRGPVNRG